MSLSRSLCSSRSIDDIGVAELRTAMERVDSIGKVLITSADTVGVMSSFSVASSAVEAHATKLGRTIQNQDERMPE